MRPERSAIALVLFAALAVLGACVAENQASTADGPIKKGGDERTGEYTPVADWWKPAPDHTDGWTWGPISAVVADNPDRILVGITYGDRNAEGEQRPYHSSNKIVAVNANGDMIENWSQWDTTVAFPHQLYISPYDPERHIWMVDRGGNGIHEQVIKFTNDGKQIVLRLLDPNPRQSGEEARANKNPGPLDFGQASTMTFLPNGDFLVADGYQNGRIIRYNEQGEFVSEFGSVGSGLGQFDLIHGVAVDRDGRIYTSDRNNDRIQVFTENGEFIEEWPDVFGPTHLHIDADENLWVLSTTTNQILKFNQQGVLQHRFGAYCCTRGGFPGGLAQPHQFAVDQAGSVYLANYAVAGTGGDFKAGVQKFVPKPDADPSKLIGPGLVLEN